MKIADLFEVRVEEKIEPVIKVGETGDEHKLATEIGSYVVTPLIEQHIDDFLEQYTDTFLSNTTRDWSVDLGILRLWQVAPRKSDGLVGAEQET